MTPPSWPPGKEWYFQSMQPTLPEEALPLARLYLDLLDRWNRVHALTALPAAERFEELILDSSSLLPYVAHLAPGSTIVDFGTGMGVPALVLAMARPDLHIVALDKSKKKIAFVRQAILELGFHHVEPLCSRAELLPHIGASVGVAKAVGSLDLLLEWWERHGQPQAPFLALKGPGWEQELPRNTAWEVRHHPYTLPTRGQRTLLQIQKKADS